MQRREGNIKEKKRLQEGAVARTGSLHFEQLNYFNNEVVSEFIIAAAVFVIIFFNLKQQVHTSLSERSDKRKLAQLVPLPADS